MSDALARITVAGQEFTLAGDTWTGADAAITRVVNAAWRLERAAPAEYGGYEPDELGAAVARLCARLGAELVWLRRPSYLDDEPGRVY